jgi:ParB family chromosome partitioning protein
MNKVGGLGKGLGSLIPSKINKDVLETGSAALAGSHMILQVPLEHITANPHQPRSTFDFDGLEELTNSIKEHGIVQPLVAIKTNHGYQLIAGERRLRAAKIIGLTTVPVLVREAKEQQQLELALVENIQRRNLNALEEAVAYQRLMDEFNLTQEQVAQKVGKNRSTVANMLRLLGLPSEIQKGLVSGAINYSTARIIVGLPPEQRLAFYTKAIAGGDVTVRSVEHAAQKVVVKKHYRKSKDPQLAAWEEELQRSLATKVHIKKTAQGGSIQIDFFSDDEFQQLLKRLR